MALCIVNLNKRPITDGNQNIEDYLSNSEIPNLSSDHEIDNVRRCSKYKSYMEIDSLKEQY